MLVQVSIRNYKVFKEEVKLTMFASNYDKSTREQENVFEVPKFGLRLLKSAVIYGANASGKTKLIDALVTLKQIVSSGAKSSQIWIEPFLLNTETEHEPTEFEVVFIHNEEMYRYGVSASKGKVHAEWLYYRPKTKEIEVFNRDGQDVSFHPRKFRKGGVIVKENLLRDDSFLISLAAQFNDDISLNVIDWFDDLEVGSRWDDNVVTGFSIGMTAEHEGLREKALALLKKADLGIEDIKPKVLGKNGKPFFEGVTNLDELIQYYNQQSDLSKPASEMDIPDLITEHLRYDGNNKIVGKTAFSLLINGSEGTKKFFAYSVPIIEALETGSPLIIDELEAKLHPNLVQAIIKLFNSEKSNPNNAQLIFTTHDSNLLGEDFFRRDQVWFVEKDRFGAASLYSLASFKTDEGGRKTDNFEEKYLQGRYGGVPVLGDFSRVFNNRT
jgi:AAA15 family ATPase/GTPase